MKKTANVYVKRIGTEEVVHTMPVPLPCSEGRQERLLNGMLRNMDTEQYFIDDHELDQARTSK